MGDRIFIQIAAYRDPELLPTLADCLARAANPDRLVFGLCWQHDEHETLGDYARDRRFRIIDIDYRRSRGPCWARHRIQQLYDGEPYTLHLDSHHRFVEGWDELCLSMFHGLQDRGVAKPLLTSYAPVYVPEDDPNGRVALPYRMRFRKFTAPGPVEALPETIDDCATMTAPLPARFFSAHFAFTLGQFCTEVPHDPKLYFFGEEPTIAVRAYTHGYDLYHPHRLVLWHHYGRDKHPKHWADHAQWPFHDHRSLERVRQLLRVDDAAPEIDFGRFGLGSVRSLRDYELYAGISYRLRGVSDHALRNLPPPEPVAPADDAELRARYYREQRFRVRLAPDEVRDEASDYDFWYVGAHSHDAVELYRYDLQGQELVDFLARAPYEREFSFHSPRFVDSWTVWPHSASRGWLEKITRPVAG
ncbi:MAG: GlcNAc-transferase family protein [Deltaproteobacteria bacterium]|nr:GlcNAc-transferase family protein [Deltaproteobacteria bacterium]